MRREEYDFEAELAQSVSAIVNNEYDQKSFHTDTIEFERIEANEDLLDFEDLSDVKKERTYVPRSSKRYPKKQNNTGLYIVVGVVGVVLLVSVFCLILALGGNSVDTDQYDYQADMGMTMYAQQDYPRAIAYFKKALTYPSQADQISLRYYLYECEKNLGNEEVAIQWLKDLLTYDSDNHVAISALAEYYNRSQQVSLLNDLIATYTGTSAEVVLKKYLNNGPGVSHHSGSYNTSIEVYLFAREGEEIRYTLDGTIPNEKDLLYTKPLKMEKGKNILKAISVSSDGRISDVLECEYDITYGMPDKPSVLPGSGTYESEQIIRIDNFVDDGSYTAHYTLNGSLPTKDSPVYTGPIDMPGGNNIFTVMFLSKDGISSTTVKRNYNLKLAAKYTFEEAQNLLKARMQKRGELTADGRNTSGQEVQFVYYRKQCINETDMYLMYCDVRKGITFERQDYLYGVDIVTGKCYFVTNSDGKFQAEEYK